MMQCGIHSITHMLYDLQVVLVMRFIAFILVLFFSHHSFAGIPVDCKCELLLVSESSAEESVVFSTEIKGWNACDIPDDPDSIGPYEYYSYKRCIEKLVSGYGSIPAGGIIRMKKIHKNLFDDE